VPFAFVVFCQPFRLEEFNRRELDGRAFNQSWFKNGDPRLLDFSWSKTEKQIARAAFDRAIENELAELIVDFKQRAAEVMSPDEMWEIGESLRKVRRDFDNKYDFKYSHLIFVFARLLREKRIRWEDLQGLADDKLEHIRRIVMD
jgi:hypothetical protein